MLLRLFETISQETINNICSEYIIGLSTIKLSKKYNIHRNLVSNILKNNNIHVSSKKKISLQIKNNIIKEYTSGKTLAFLKNKYKIHPRNIAQVLKENNIKLQKHPKRKYYHDENIFTVINSHEKAYWLGFIAGDGCIVNKELSVELSNKDVTHLEKLRSFLKSNHKFYYYKRTHSLDKLVKGTVESLSLRIYSPIMVKDLAKYDIVPRKTFKEKMPNIKNKYLNSFILGFWDADGSWISSNRINGYKDYKSSLVGNIEILKQIQNIFIKKLHLNKIKLIRSKESPKMYYLRYGGNKQTANIARFLYKDSPIFLDRKRNIIAHLINEG